MTHRHLSQAQLAELSLGEYAAVSRRGELNHLLRPNEVTAKQLFGEWDPRDALAFIDEGHARHLGLEPGARRAEVEVPHEGGERLGDADLGARPGKPLGQVTREELASMSDAEYGRAKRAGRLTQLLRGEW